uniref:Uncharacterized protein n=1 Tax=Anopheles atroparvus TaxID=41427 RepID=A0AAG5DDX3_ANOAO
MHHAVRGFEILLLASLLHSIFSLRHDKQLIFHKLPRLQGFSELFNYHFLKCWIHFVAILMSHVFSYPTEFMSLVACFNRWKYN